MEWFIKTTKEKKSPEKRDKQWGERNSVTGYLEEEEREGLCTGGIAGRNLSAL